MTVHCEAYSGQCVTETPLLDYPFDAPIERVPATGTATTESKELPLTGISYGDILSVALILVLTGVILLLVVKKFFK